MAYQDYGNELDMLQGQIEQAGPQQPQPLAFAPQPEPYTGGINPVSDINQQMPDRGDIWGRPSRGQPGQGRAASNRMQQLQRRRQMAKQWLGQSGRPSPMRDRAVAGPGGVPTNPMIKAQGGQMQRQVVPGGGGFPTQARGNAWGRSNRFQMGRSPAMGRKFQKGFSNQYNQLLGTTAGGSEPMNLQPDSAVRQRIGAMTTNTGITGNRMPAGGGMASTNRMPAGGGMATDNRAPGAPPPSSPQPSGGVVGPQQGGASAPGAGGGGAAGGSALRDKIAARRKALMAAQGR